MADTMSAMPGSSNTEHNGSSSQQSSPSQLTLDPAHGSTFTFTVNPSSSPNADPVKDKWAHTRMKRKRTSPQDFAVLELEYEKNTRPDKKMRVDLSERVSMSEKEIQIWFQNRRQVTRRKGRTWQPNEISSLIRDANEDPETQNTTHRASSVGRDERPITSSPDGGSSSSPNSQRTDRSDGFEEDHNNASISEIKDAGRTEQVARAIESDREISTTQEADIPKGVADASGTEKQQAKKHVEVSAPTTRLSMGADGTAKLVVGLGTPSPPSKRTKPLNWASRSNVLRRAQSLFFEPKIPSATHTPLTPQANSSSTFSKPLPNALMGRSANTKAWERACEHEKKSPLDKTDSAAASFRTLKNLSSVNSISRPPLSPALGAMSRHNVMQKNGSPQTENLTQKLTKTSSPLLSASRPKLTRTMSSLARIENSSQRSTSKGLGIMSSKKKADIEIWEDEHGDSDKENRGPDGSLISINHSGRALNAPVTKKVLGASVHGATNGKPRQRSALVRSATTSALARTGHASGSAQPEADMDAIQNLLSLSQGAWK